MTLSDRAYQTVTQYALSLVLSQQSGVRAFLPTFLVSLLSLVRPDIVELSGTMSWLKHPASASISGILAAAEMAASMIPGIENIVQSVMTFVHPIMGVVNAVAPNLGDATAYTQGPMAVFGGSQALILHLIKLLLRVLGLGFLGPCIACIEHTIVFAAVPLAIFFGSLAIALAACFLLALGRWIYRVVMGAPIMDKEAALLPEAKSSKLKNYVKREHSILSLIYLREDEGVRRAPRVGLLCVVLVAHLWLVAVFLQTSMAPIAQDIVVALCLAPLRAVCRALVKGAAKKERDRALGPRAAAVLAVLLAVFLYAASDALLDIKPHQAGLVVVNFLTSAFINFAVFEPLELVFIFEFCKTCCFCCAFCFIDDDDIKKAEEDP